MVPRWYRSAFAPQSGQYCTALLDGTLRRDKDIEYFIPRYLADDSFGVNPHSRVVRALNDIQLLMRQDW